MGKSKRLRRAILGLYADDEIVPLVTVEDVSRKWVFLCDSGTTPFQLAKEANSEKITDSRFKELMQLLNSYL